MKLANERLRFRDRLGEIVDELNRLSIDHRVIGSVAVDAHGILPVAFESRNSVEDIDSRPDLDLIVPRDQLYGAREVRERATASSYPVKVGLAIPSTQVDLLPGEAASRLTLGSRSVDIDTASFDSTDVSFEDLPIPAVSPETLRHFYSSMTLADGAGEKYALKLAAFDIVLGPDTGHPAGSTYAAFHDYRRLLDEHTTIARRSVELFDRITRDMSPERSSRLKRIAFAIGGVAGWR